MEEEIIFQDFSHEVSIGGKLDLKIPLVFKENLLDLESFDISVSQRSVINSFNYAVSGGKDEFGNTLFKEIQKAKKDVFFNSVSMPTLKADGTILSITLEGFNKTKNYQIWGKVVSKGKEYKIAIESFNVSHVVLTTLGSFKTSSPTDFNDLAQKAREVISDVKEEAKNFFRELKAEEQSNIQKVSLTEPNRNPTLDQYIWMYIRNGVIDFEHYKLFIDAVMCDDSILSTNTRTDIQKRKKDWGKQLPFLRTDAFGILKFATDFYMQEYFKIVQGEDKIFDNTLMKKGAYEVDGFEDEAQRTKINIDEIKGFISQKKASNRNYWLNGTDYLPYFETVMTRIPFDFKENLGKIACEDDFPDDFMADTNLLELIWSYWHEEGGLVQTMNAISLRFQNVRAGSNDPLAGLNIDPLRPINNLVWGYIEDERNRLSMARRNLEYQYEYGISLIGKAVANIQVAESRSQFLPGFHNLLKTAIDFYQQANYTTVIPDGFPVLNSLREVHLLLSEGAHNQFGSLPWTARAEMLMQQWLLARPEMREFLGGRIMMPYNEPWMDRVDTMKTIQGWNPTNITHFHDLGAFGEQLLLSIRYGSWNDPSQTRDNAANWAYYWREEIQRYVHAYKAATGVDLGNDVTDARIAMPQNVERYTQPSVLIGRRVNSLPNNRPSQLNRLTQRRNIERY